MCVQFNGTADKLIGTLGTAARCNALMETLINIRDGIADETDYEILLEILAYLSEWSADELRELFHGVRVQEYIWLDNIMEEDECPD